MLKTILVLGLVLQPIPQEPVPPTYYAEQLDESHYKSVGEYELTAYVSTGNACADGKMPCEGVTVASNDPKLWHKCIYIKGYGMFFVHDRGGMASNVIDVFIDDYSAAVQFGRQKAEVYIVE